MAKKKAIDLTEDHFHCPTLTPHEQSYLIQKARESAKALVESSRSSHGPILWTEAGVHKGVQMYKGAARDPDAIPSGEQAQYVCGAITIQATIEEVAEFMDVSTTPKMKEFVRFQDDLLDGLVLYTLVEPRPENQFLHQVTVKWTAGNVPSPIIRDRDFLTLECQDVFTDTTGRRGWVRAYHSIKLPCCPELRNELGLVRGSFYHTGYVFVESEKPGHLDCIHTFQINLKGNVILPSAIYFMAMKRRIGAVGELEKSLQERRLGKQAYLSDLDLVPKHLRVRCHVCASKFGMMTRKSRCRKCGEVVCHDCSQIWAICLPKIGHKKVRVCARCFGTDGPRDTDFTNGSQDNQSLSSDRQSISMGSELNHQHHQPLPPPRPQSPPSLMYDPEEMFRRQDKNPPRSVHSRPQNPPRDDPRGPHGPTDPHRTRSFLTESDFGDRQPRQPPSRGGYSGGPPRYDRYQEDYGHDQGYPYPQQPYPHANYAPPPPQYPHHHADDYHNRVGPPSRDARSQLRGDSGSYSGDERGRGFQHYPPRQPSHAGGYPPDQHHQRSIGKPQASPGHGKVYGQRPTDETGSTTSAGSRHSGSLTAHALEQHTRQQDHRAPPSSSSSVHRHAGYNGPPYQDNQGYAPYPPHYPYPQPHSQQQQYYRDGLYGREPPMHSSPNRLRGAPQWEGSAYGHGSYASDHQRPPPPPFHHGASPGAPMATLPPPPPPPPYQRDVMDARESPLVMERPVRSKGDARSTTSLDSHTFANVNHNQNQQEPRQEQVDTLAVNATRLMLKQNEIQQQLEIQQRNFLTDDEGEDDDEDREYGVDDWSEEEPHSQGVDSNQTQALVEEFNQLMRPESSRPPAREPQLSFAETVDIDVVRSETNKPELVAETKPLSVVEIYQQILELTQQQHTLESNADADPAHKDAVANQLRSLYEKLNDASADRAVAF